MLGGEFGNNGETGVDVYEVEVCYVSVGDAEGGVEGARDGGGGEEVRAAPEGGSVRGAGAAEGVDPGGFGDVQGFGDGGGCEDAGGGEVDRVEGVHQERVYQ